MTGVHQLFIDLTTELNYMENYKYTILSVITNHALCLLSDNLTPKQAHICFVWSDTVLNRQKPLFEQANIAIM